MRTYLMVLLCVFSTAASATNYYVSSSSGNDALDGKSPATAWKTISKINSKTFSPGDSILFKKGDVWRETLTVPSSGSTGSYLVFASYGSGVNPKILGSKTTTWADQGGNIWKSETTFSNPYGGTYGAEVFFENSDGSVKWGVHQASTGALVAEYNWCWASNYIYVYSATDPDSRYISVEVPQRNNIIDLNSKEYLNFNGIDLHYSIQTGTTYAGWPMSSKHGLIIEYAHISHIGTKGSEMAYGISGGYSDCIVRHCEINDCGRRSIDYHIYGSGYTITNLIFEDNDFHDGWHTTGVDISVGSSSYTASIDSVIIRRNRFYDPPTTNGFSELIFIQNSNGGGAGAHLDRIYIYNNIFINSSNSGVHMETSNGVRIYNNIFYNHNTSSPSNTFHINISAVSPGHCTSTTIKNNIFYSTSTYTGSGGCPIFVKSGAIVNNAAVIADYNMYWRYNNSVRVVEFESSATYNMTQIATLQSVRGWETHGQFISPAFASTSDYHVLGGSPAIGAGIAIPEVITDFEGNTFSNPPNIGCYATPGGTANLNYVSSAIENATPSQLTMTYNLPLANIVPAASAFSVQVNSVSRTIGSVAIVSGKVQLTLSAPIIFGDVVTVSYTKPATNPLQTSTGGQAASISSQPVTNNCGAVSPVYVSSSIENATPSMLSITYNLALANIVSASSAFSVQVNSVSRAIASVAIVSGKIQLTLSTPVIFGDVVTVSYTKPASNPLQTTSGGQAASISAQPVTNNCGAVAPVYVSSSIENATPSLVTMTYNLALANIVPASSSFSVQVNSVSRVIGSVAIVSGKVQLTLSTPVIFGDIVTVSYTKPATNPLQTTSGGQAASITAQPVTNNCGAVAPVYVSSSIENATPSLLSMNYNLALANIVPASSSFSVQVNSVSRAIASVAIVSGKVQLTLSTPVIFGDVVTVSYTKPATNPLQTTSGAQSASITAQPVTNNCGAVAPVYVSSSIENATPSLLSMTYNLALANIVPTSSAFSVQVNSVSRAIGSVAIVSGKVQLTLSTPVIFSDIVTVSYIKPATNPLQTTSGGQAASITAQPVTNNCGAVSPVYVSSSVENATPSLLTMTYNLALANIVPASSAFSVQVNSVSRTIGSVAIVSGKVQLTLSTPIIFGDIVTVSYTKPATNPLQTTSGGQAASITAQPVTNNCGAVGPVYVSSSIENITPSLLTMTYNLALANIVPASSAFSVQVNSVSRAIGSVAIVSGKVQLTLSTPVIFSDIVTVSYIKPATNPLQTTSGGQAASITAQPVTNNCGAVSPVYVSSSVENATPSLLTMTYNLALANIVPASSAFSVQVNSVSRTIGSVAIVSGKVQLTLSTPIIFGDIVTVSYTKPATNPLQTTSGGQAASITAQPVTNNCGAVSPVYVSSSIENITPSLLTMTYNLALANIVPASSAFSVQVNSVSRAIGSVAIVSGKVQLTLVSSVTFNDIITISYTKPSTNPLQTTSGGQAASIYSQPVINNINYVNTPPVIVINYNKSVYSGFIGEIDASLSYDANNDPLKFEWIVPGNLEVSSTTGQKIQFLAPIVKYTQTINFILNLSDGNSIQTKSIPVTILPYRTRYPRWKTASIVSGNTKSTDNAYNLIDDNIETSWSSNGSDQSVIFELGHPFELNYIELAFQKDQNTESHFDIWASKDNLLWEPLLIDATSSNFAQGYQIFDIPEAKNTTKYSYVKLINHGNQENLSVNISEFAVFGTSDLEEFKMTLYPNPAKTFVNILFEDPDPGIVEPSSTSYGIIRIYDPRGAIVAEKILDPNVRNIQLPLNIKSGTYFVNLISNGVTIAVQRLIIIN